jgi:fluoride exporter
MINDIISALIKLSVIGLAGGIGTLCRYGLGGLVQGDKLFPWGTAAVNLLGCLAFGLIYAALQRRSLIGSEYQLVILLGFMGGFTTFSSYMYELAEQLRGGEWLAASGYFALHNLGGFAAMVFGLMIGKWI